MLSDVHNRLAGHWASVNTNWTVMHAVGVVVSGAASGGYQHRRSERGNQTWAAQYAAHFRATGTCLETCIETLTAPWPGPHG